MNHKPLVNLPDCTPLNTCRSVALEHKRLVHMLGGVASGELDMSLTELEERVRQSEAALAEAKRAAQTTLDAIPPGSLRNVCSAYFLDGLTRKETGYCCECSMRQVDRHLKLIREHCQGA